MSETRQPVHATVAALRWNGGWRGVLIQGPSGAGKSDLALRLIQNGWRLVGDDWVHVWASGGRLYAAAPATIAGQMEVRGVGVLSGPALPLARLALSLRLTHEPVERMPEAAWRTYDGVRLPRLDLNPRPASAAAVAEAALKAVLQRERTATPPAL